MLLGVKDLEQFAAKALLRVRVKLEEAFQASAVARLLITQVQHTHLLCVRQRSEVCQGSWLGPIGENMIFCSRDEGLRNQLNCIHMIHYVLLHAAKVGSTTIIGHAVDVLLIPVHLELDRVRDDRAKVEEHVDLIFFNLA